MAMLLLQIFHLNANFFNIDGVTQNNIMVQSNVSNDDVFWNELFNVEFLSTDSNYMVDNNWRFLMSTQHLRMFSSIFKIAQY
jgi:hypothetical protein